MRRHNQHVEEQSFSRWVHFAMEDFAAAEALLKERISNQVCFHCQQAAEKMLKAFLKSQRITPPKIHNLLELLEICKTKNKKFNLLQEECEYLSRFYLSSRYPDALPGYLPEGLPSFKEAGKAINFAEEIINFVKKILAG